MECLSPRMFRTLLIKSTSFFLCNELKEGYLSGALGEYIIPQGCFIDENKVDEFDKKFPKKKKTRKSNILIGIYFI